MSSSWITFQVKWSSGLAEILCQPIYGVTINRNFSKNRHLHFPLKISAVYLYPLNIRISCRWLLQDFKRYAYWCGSIGDLNYENKSLLLPTLKLLCLQYIDFFDFYQRRFE